MAKTDLRKFRHDISILKKKGLIEGVDARSAKPTAALTKLVNRFDDVLSGKATPVKLSKQETANLKKAGYDVYKGKTIYPHSAGEKVSISKGHAKVKRASGIETLTVPVEYHNLEGYLKALKKNKRIVNAMKDGDQYFAFRFYGHNSLSIYRNIDLLLEDLTRYEAIESARNSKSAKSMNEIYRNLEIVTVNRPGDWKANTQSKKAARRAEYKRKRASKPKRSSITDDERRANAAVRQQEYRDRMNATAKKKYQKAARQRAAKSANRRKRREKDSRS